MAMTMEQIVTIVNEIFPGGEQEFRAHLQSLVAQGQVRVLEARVAIAEEDRQAALVVAEQEYQAAQLALANKKAEIRAFLRAQAGG